MRPVALTLALLVVAPGARAETTTPYPGVEHTKTTADGQWRHVVTIDLRRPSLSLRMSSEANRGKTVSSIAEAEGAVIAVNASFFREDHSVCGVAVARGTPWKRVHDDRCIHGIGWGRAPESWTLFSTKGLAKGPFPAGVTEVVSGYPTLLNGGVPCDGSTPVCAIPSAAPASFREKNPRTILGVDAARTKAFLVVVDGRRADAAGLALEESIALLRSLGVHDAVNLDGGGSTELWIEGEGGVVNEPSDGGERVVASAVLVGVAGSEVGSGSGSGSGTGSGPRRWPSGAGFVAGVAVIGGLGWLVRRRMQRRA